MSAIAPRTNKERYEALLRAKGLSCNANEPGVLMRCPLCGTYYRRDSDSVDERWMRARLPGAPEEYWRCVCKGSYVHEALLSEEGEKLCRERNIPWPSLKDEMTTPEAPKRPTNAERYKAIDDAHPHKKGKPFVLRCACGSGWMLDRDPDFDADWLRGHAATNPNVFTSCSCGNKIQDAVLSPAGEAICKAHNIPWPSLKDEAVATTITTDGAVLAVASSVTNTATSITSTTTAELSQAVEKTIEKFLQQKESKTPMAIESTTKPAPPPTVMQQVAETAAQDFGEAKWRVAARQITDLAKAPLLVAVTKNLGPDDVLRQRLAQFLDSDLGEAFVQGLLGMGLSGLPFDHPALHRLARELRIEGMAGAGDVVASMVTGPVIEALAGLARQNPAMAQELRGLPLPGAPASDVFQVQEHKEKVPA